jgi:hypothetical protein
MHRQISTRLFAVGLAAGTLMVAPLAAPGSAAVATGPQCTKIVSPPPVTINKVLTSKSTVSSCTPTATTGGSGKSVTQIGVKYKGKSVEALSTTTWAGGKGTTIATLSYAAAKALGNCPKGSTAREVTTGSVVGGTNKLIKVGSKESATVCVAKNSSATLAPGTVWKF